MAAHNLGLSSPPSPPPNFLLYLLNRYVRIQW